MKRKTLISLMVILSLIVVMLFAIPLGGCAGEEEEFKSWNLNGNVTASFSDNGKYGYILNVEGTGAMPDYTSKKDAPWYGKSGRVTEIKISEGITAIGSNAFTEIKAKNVILPATVASVGANSFNTETLICAYAQVTAPQGVTVYLYSENAPATAGDYWHTVNGILTVWPKEVKTQKILFIGNSFTYYNDMPEQIFSPLATSMGASVQVSSVTKGSQTFTNWVNPANEDGIRLDAALKAVNDYDVAVIQEQSTRPLNNYDQFSSGAQTLAQKIRDTQTKCDIYMYSTWGYASQAEARKITIPEMEAQLRKAYTDVASSINATVSYAGKAFSYVYENHPAINLYNAEDNMHPSYEGSYLAACVHAATILGLDPRTATFTGNLDEATATILRNAAYSIVFEG